MNEHQPRRRRMASDETLYGVAVAAIYVMCPLTVLPLLFMVAPYGRHVRPGWGPSLPAPLAWFLMESPTLWLTLFLYPRGRHRDHPLALAVVGLYLLHYFNRTIIYPLRLLSAARKKRSADATFPLSMALMGFAFNLHNAYIQSRSASHYAEYPNEWSRWTVWARMAAGLGVFFWGMSVNVRSDLALVRLKAEGGGGYKIPRGGWFEAVSCPNYMGEMAEWLGWAVVAWSPAALGFFLYTCSNLGPRAVSNHRWYKDKFGEDYPPSRKAFIPFVF